MMRIESSGGRGTGSTLRLRQSRRSACPAWPNKDGKGFNVSCDLVPLHGRIVMRFITAREALQDGGQS